MKRRLFLALLTLLASLAGFAVWILILYVIENFPELDFR